MSNVRVFLFWSGRREDGQQVRNDRWSEATLSRTCVVTLEHKGRFYKQEEAVAFADEPLASKVDVATAGAVARAVDRIMRDIAWIEERGAAA